MNRILVTKGSVRIFFCGLASLIPLVGFPFALYCAVAAIRLGSRFKGEWNPAARYLRWGMELALLSLGLNSIAGLIVLLQLVPPFGEN